MISYRRKSVLLVLSILLPGLTSCACMPPAPGLQRTQPAGYLLPCAEHPGFWWSCGFKVHWPPGEEPDFSIDLFLAHAVVRPVLMKSGANLLYWRFHRRAARDSAGHNFSFLFYSDPHTAQKIMDGINESSLLHDALAAGIVERVSLDDPNHPARPAIEAFSDSHWSLILQRSWPAYIMGVSSLWLKLIDEVVAEIPPAGTTMEDLLARYRKADDRVSVIWRQEGQHAFLHHLNAIFGYKPLLIRKEITF